MFQINHRLWPVWVAGLILFSLGCGLASRLPLQAEATLPPTRTALPTFTPTEPAQLAVVTLPPPTETPLSEAPSEPPPAAEVAEPEVVATDTATPEPTATETPLPEPTATEAPAPPPPPPPPPTEPPPTEPPPPAAPVAGANGVIGQITFREGRNTYSAGEKVFVKIEATNTEPGLKPFGILGLTASNGNFQTSWSSGSIAAGETFRHEDGLPFSAPGNYKLWLSICFSTIDVCQGPDGNWERFEPGLDVIIQ